MIHFILWSILDFDPFWILIHFIFRSILWLCSIFGFYPLFLIFWSIFGIHTFEIFDNKSEFQSCFLFSRFITLWWHLWNINMKNISSFSLLDTCIDDVSLLLPLDIQWHWRLDFLFLMNMLLQNSDLIFCADSRKNI